MMFTLSSFLIFTLHSAFLVVVLLALIFSFRLFQVVQHPDKGQCLVATRQIKPLEIILSEKPTILGPYTRPAKHQCLECFKLINEDQKCSKCLYPVCDLKCQDGNWHLIECQIFQSVGHTYRQPNSEDGDKSSSGDVGFEQHTFFWKNVNIFKRFYSLCWTVCIRYALF